MPEAPDFQSRTVGGKYTIGKRVAIGGFASVWKARAPGRKTPVAVKIMHPAAAKDRGARSAFDQEYKICRAFDSPELLACLDSGTHTHGKQALPFLVQEYFESVNLRRCIEGDTELPLKKLTRRIILAVAKGLAYIHGRGIIHRDVKPENILVNGQGAARLIDFGNAQVGESRWSPFRNKVAGSPSYMAPEQIRKQPVSHAADIYAFGATLYCLVAGRPPFVADDDNDVLRQQVSAKPTPLFKVNKRVSWDFDNLVMAMLAKKPADRPQDMDEWLERFQTISLYG